MKNTFYLVLIFCLALAPDSSWAAEGQKKDESATDSKELSLESQLSYPELEVTPRASERLDIEFKNEKRTSWLTHLPIQFSALATLYAGTGSSIKDGATAEENDSYENAQKIAVGVGGGWLALTAALSAAYRPYRAGRVEISKLPKGTAREQLTRERISEEALYAPAALANKLKWFSVATNLYASSSLVINSHTDSRLSIGVAIAASFAPLIFESRWSQVADTHRNYKKKIYGPMAMSTIIPAGENRLAPGVALHWTF